MKEYRRYEILLPRRFNDGRPVSAALLRQTYRDELVRMFVDVPAAHEQDQFFQDFKETLKARFQQLEIWVTSHDIRVF